MVYLLMSVRDSGASFLYQLEDENWMLVFCFVFYSLSICELKSIKKILREIELGSIERGIAC